jgi:hypothetical protein
MVSAGRSEVKPQGRMDIFQGSEAKNVLAAVSTSEVFFDRYSARSDGKTELGSLFNPYWQVHIVGNSVEDVAAATALQGVPP